jgi:ABC-2 type transport system ATP-binding protein
MEEAQLLCDEIVIVDHGRIIAQGAPQTLLREHFKAVLLELPGEDWTPAARGLGVSFFEAAGRVELTTNDLEGTLRTLMQAGVSLAHLSIRPPNLEDLFLELTGKDLRA